MSLDDRDPGERAGGGVSAASRGPLGGRIPYGREPAGACRRKCVDTDPPDDCRNVVTPIRRNTSVRARMDELVAVELGIDLPRRPGRPRIGPRWIVSGLTDYGPAFAVEVGLFVAVLLGFQLSGYLRQPPWVHGLPLGTLLVAVAMGAAEARFRLYRRVWVVAGLTDALAIAMAVMYATVLISVANALIPDAARPFRFLVPALAGPAVIAVVSVFRLLPRLTSRAPQGRNRLLVVAADGTALPMIKSIIQNSDPAWQPVAILTGDSTQLNQTVLGVPVLGRIDELEHWLEASRADGVAFVPGAGANSDLPSLVGRCIGAELPIFIAPGPGEWLRGRSRGSMRQLSADDLVGRSERELDLEAVKDLVAGRVVMVTGAAGSIGSELCRLLAELRPKRLVLLDNNESGLFDIAEELRAGGPGVTELREALVSIVDRKLLLRLFADERPDIVFHAAAYKHVPMLERHPEQAVLGNVIGTYNLVRCAEASGVGSLVLVSTDKAVSKQSIMGCTKRLCELIVLSHSGTVDCWAVRFGNVVGSRGSVVPFFERQIGQGGPVTITHPEATRYLMTIREAASLVVSTLGLACPGHLYMLDMGAPIRIMALAEALIRSRGMRPGSDIEIVYTGLRPGEALTEDLLSPDEGFRPTFHPSIMEVVSPHPFTMVDLEWIVQQVTEMVAQDRRDELVRLIKRTVTAPARNQRLGDLLDTRPARTPASPRLPKATSGQT